jgi:tRNA-dihydrouridine synthase A
MIGLRNGLPGARRWRQVWSDPRLKNDAPEIAWHLAQQALAAAAEQEPRPSDAAAEVTA